MKVAYARLAGFCAANRVLTAGFVTLTLSLLFACVPSIDLGVSRLFYVPGEGFPLAGNTMLLHLRDVGSDVPVAVAIVVIAGLVLKLLFPARPFLFPPRFTLFFASLYLLGPVLLVNGVLKSFWGRPRPVKIEEFGGHSLFVDAWSFGAQMFTHRSFTSGEAATVACLLPLALFVPRPWRAPVAALIGVFIVAVSMNRVAFGGHFLSDVTLSIALVLTIAIALRQVFYVSHAELFSDRRIEDEMTRFGLAWRARIRRDLNAIGATIRAGVKAVGLSLRPAR